VARWRELEVAATSLAAEGRRLLDRHHLLLAGTIRCDGTPRISPIEAHIVEGELVHAMIAGTLKVRDLRRDPRIVLNSPVLHPGDPNEELKLRRRVRPVEDTALLAAAHGKFEAVSGWRPQPDWPVFAVDLEEAAFIRWAGRVMHMSRWTGSGDLVETSRPVAVLDE